MNSGRIRVFATGSPAFASLDSNVSPARAVRFEAKAGPTSVIVSPQYKNVTKRVTSRSIHRVWSSEARRLSHLATPCMTDRAIYCGIVDDARGIDGGVVAIDLDTGRSRWASAFEGSVEAPILAVEDKLFAITQTGSVHCLRAADGQIRWKYDLPNAHNRWIYGPPTLVGDSVVVGTTSCLVCIGTESGEKRWEYRSPLKTTDSFGQFQRAMHADGKVFLAGYKSGSVLLDVATGTVLRLNDDVALRCTSRVAENGRYYVVGDGKGSLSCFDVGTGALVWRQKISTNVITSAFVPFMGGLLGGTAEGLVYCSMLDGRVLARRSFGKDLQRFVAYRDYVRSCPGSPCVDDERAWVASGDGCLNLISGTKLRLIDRMRLAHPIISGLILTTAKQVFGVSLDGTLHRFARSTPSASERKNSFESIPLKAGDRRGHVAAPAGTKS